MFYPMFRDTFADYLVEQGILVVTSNPLPGISYYFDRFGLICVLLFTFIVLILNLIFFADNKEIIKRRLIFVFLAMAISIMIFTLFGLIVNEFQTIDVGYSYSLRQYYEDNTFSILPILFIFIWVDYLLSVYFISFKLHIDDKTYAVLD
jgi:hypothetical protein